MHYSTRAPAYPSALRRFMDSVPFRTLATNSFASGVFLQPHARALQMREIAPDNDKWISSIRIDVDHADASTRWLDAELPQPSLLIVNRDNGHAHMVWQLESWVPRFNRSAVRYLQTVRRLLTEAVGGDPAYSGLLVHNPASGAFTVYEGPPCYTLGALARHLDLAGTATSPYAIRITSPGGRNQGLFTTLRIAAYRRVREFRARDDRKGFGDWVASVAAEENAAFAAPLSDREVAGICRSVAGWTWARYAKVTPMRRRRFKRTRAQYLGLVADRRTTALQMAFSGTRAAEVASALGISRRSVERWVAAAKVSAARAA
jgi:hypothetical protein